MIEYALSFVAVVNAGTFSAAAKNADLSKACLSRHVSQLEAILGVQLLHRTTRTVILTEAGKRFYDACQLIQENYQEAVHTITHDLHSMEGKLRITAPIDLGTRFLPAVIDEFSRLYPLMNVVLTLSNEKEMLIEKNYDIAIRIANQLPDSNLRMSTLFSFKQLLCATPIYLKDKGVPASLEDLKEHRCITSVNRNKNVINPQWKFNINKKTISCVLSHYLEIDSLVGQLDLIKRSAGIGRMPDYLIRDMIKKGELNQVLPSVDSPDFYIYLLYPDTDILPHKTRVLIDFIKKHLSIYQ